MSDDTTQAIERLSRRADEHLMDWLKTDEGDDARLALCASVGLPATPEMLALVLKLGFVHGLRVADEIWQAKVAR